MDVVDRAGGRGWNFEEGDCGRCVHKRVGARLAPAGDFSCATICVADGTRPRNGRRAAHGESARHTEKVNCVELWVSTSEAHIRLGRNPWKRDAECAHLTTF